MPYKLKGNDVYHQVDENGKMVWKLKQHTTSPANAKKALRLLNALEHNPKFAKKIKDSGGK